MLHQMLHHFWPFPPAADRGLSVSEGGWGEREKKHVLSLLYFDYSAGASSRGRRDCLGVREDWG